MKTPGQQLSLFEWYESIIRTIKAHSALYGAVSLVKGFCPFCQTEAFILDDEFQCCGAQIKIEALEAPSRSSPTVGRKFHKISQPEKKAILQKQGYLCFYCGHHFGETIRKRKGESVVLKVTFDHITPFIVALESDTNIVASCQLCNAIKHDTVFESIKEARLYIKERWRKKGYEQVY